MKRHRGGMMNMNTMTGIMLQNHSTLGYWFSEYYLLLPFMEHEMHEIIAMLRRLDGWMVAVQQINRV